MSDIVLENCLNDVKVHIVSDKNKKLKEYFFEKFLVELKKVLFDNGEEYFFNKTFNIYFGTVAKKVLRNNKRYLKIDPYGISSDLFLQDLVNFIKWYPYEIINDSFLQDHVVTLLRDNGKYNIGDSLCYVLDRVILDSFEIRLIATQYTRKPKKLVEALLITRFNQILNTNMTTICWYEEFFNEIDDAFKKIKCLYRKVNEVSYISRKVLSVVFFDECDMRIFGGGVPLSSEETIRKTLQYFKEDVKFV